MVLGQTLAGAAETWLPSLLPLLRNEP